jgi:MGT family glycosyltransferase
MRDEKTCARLMARILFLNIPAQGHVNPTLAVVGELVSRGEQVYYALPERWREAVRSVGGTFISLPEGLQLNVSSRQAHISHDARISLLPYAMADQAARVVPTLVSLVGELAPDCLVFSELDLWGRLVARLTPVRTVAFRTFHGPAQRVPVAPSHTGSLLEFTQQAERTFAEFTTNHGIGSLAQIRAEVINPTIVFVTESFQIERREFDDRYVFVGPSLRPAEPLPPELALRESERVLISLGTLRNDEPAFYRQCIAAFSGIDVQVFLSIGSTVTPMALGAIPDNVLVRPHLPQTSLLGQVGLFITHAGLNSVMESLYYGVPMLLLPGTSEQRLSAERAQELNLGIRAKLAEISVDDLRGLSRQILEDASIHRAVKAMQNNIHASGGYAKAADVILNVAKS